MMKLREFVDFKIKDSLQYKSKPPTNILLHPLDYLELINMPELKDSPELNLDWFQGKPSYKKVPIKISKQAVIHGTSIIKKKLGIDEPQIETMRQPERDAVSYVPLEVDPFDMTLEAPSVDATSWRIIRGERSSDGTETITEERILPNGDLETRTRYQQHPIQTTRESWELMPLQELSLTDRPLRRRRSTRRRVDVPARGEIREVHLRSDPATYEREYNAEFLCRDEDGFFETDESS